MKLDETVLVELIDIVLHGITKMKDVSEELRELDLVVSENGNLTLSEEYKAKERRK